MIEENTIFETKVIEVPPEQTTDMYTNGYLDALDAILDILESGGGPEGDDDDDDGGGGGPKMFPDPRLIMPQKQGGKSQKDNSKYHPDNKTLDIDTGEERDPQKEEEQKEDNQQKANESAEGAQKAADAAKEASERAQKNADAADAVASTSSDEVINKKAEKAKKAAEKAQKAAEKAQKAADKAQKAAEKGDANAAKMAENEAKEQANIAKMAANEMAHSSEVENMNSEQAAEDAQKSAQKARELADEARKIADDINASGEDEDIKKMANKAAQIAEKAAKDTEKAAEQAESASKNRNLDKAQEAAQKAREALDMAQAAKNSTERTNELNQDSIDNNAWSSKNMSEKDKHADPKKLKGDLYDCTEYVEKVQQKFENKLTGPLGDYLNKCRESRQDIKRIKRDEKSLSVKTYVKKGRNAWDAEFKTIIDAYISSCIRERKHEMRSTYMRPNRRQGQVQVGDVIKRGKTPKKNKMDITITFYIDISGSMMGSKIINAFKCAYAYSDFIKRKNQSESIIDSFDYTFYAFNTKFYKIEGKKIPSATGDNVPFNQILEYIEEHSLNDMINIIITDAQFSIAPQDSIKCIKRTSGLFIVIANSNKNESDFTIMKDALKEKFEYLIADSEFTFKEPN